MSYLGNPPHTKERITINLDCKKNKHQGFFSVRKFIDFIFLHRLKNRTKRNIKQQIKCPKYNKNRTQNIRCFLSVNSKVFPISRVLLSDNSNRFSSQNFSKSNDGYILNPNFMNPALIRNPQLNNCAF